MKTTSILLTSLIATVAAHAEMVVYQIDPVHSSVNFKVRHFMNKVNGSFGSFQGEVHVDPETMTNSKAKAEIKTASVNTNNDKRDAHLQRDDYFSAGEFPVMTFETTAWKAGEGENEYEVTGNLTLLGVTKPVTLDVEYLGKQDGIGHYEGMEIIGFSAEGEIDRSEWGLDAGGPIVGNEVEIEISIQGHRKKS